MNSGRIPFLKFGRYWSSKSESRVCSMKSVSTAPGQMVVEATFL